MLLRIKVVRMDQALTQLDLSLASGISQGRYSLIERGKLSPSDGERERLAQILETSATTLFHPACRVRPAHSPQSTGAPA
jgi:transcriptional regulator with XRE-family HTH domain